MSGLKHNFSTENETNLQNVSNQSTDVETHVDPIDERKQRNTVAMKCKRITYTVVLFFSVI